MRLPPGAALLRDPGFGRLFSAALVSVFGSAMTPIAVAFAVLELTDSPRLVGVVIAAQTAAQAGVQLFAGTLADRWSRQRLMVAADLLAAASQASMALLLFAGARSIAAIAALMALNGVSFACQLPAALGLVPQVVPRERLQAANALLSLARSGAFGLGGATAGLIISGAGAAWAIAVDAATFLASAGLIAGIRPGPQVQVRGAGASVLRELREGWREFTAHRWLWAIVAQFSLVMAGWFGGFAVVGPVVADRFLGGAAAWGWVAGGFGAGLLAGGALGMRLPVRRPMLVGTLCVLLQPLPLLLLIAPAPVPAIAAGAFMAGLAAELFTVLWNTALQMHVPPHALSRVGSYDILGSMVLAPLGALLAGPAVEMLGTRATLWIGVGLMVLPTLAVLGVREVRTLESSPAGAASPDRFD